MAPQTAKPSRPPRTAVWIRARVGGDAGLPPEDSSMGLTAAPIRSNTDLGGTIRSGQRRGLLDAHRALAGKSEQCWGEAAADAFIWAVFETPGAGQAGAAIWLVASAALAKRKADQFGGEDQAHPNPKEP